jgi:hypothetical protein
MKKPLSKLERVPLREAWKHEANPVEWLLGLIDNSAYAQLSKRGSNDNHKNKRHRSGMGRT